MLTKILKTLKNDKGSAYIDSAIKLIIAIILAAILLFGFFAILKSGVLPGIQAHIDGNMNGGQVQAMTDIGKAYTRWKNDFVAEVIGNKEEIVQFDDAKIIYGLANGLLTYEDWENLSEDELAAKIQNVNVVIPENNPEVVIYWFYASLRYLDGSDETFMTEQEFKDFERTDEGKAEIMTKIGS